MYDGATGNILPKRDQDSNQLLPRPELLYPNLILIHYLLKNPKRKNNNPYITLNKEKVVFGGFKQLVVTYSTLRSLNTGCIDWRDVPVRFVRTPHTHLSQGRRGSDEKAGDQN